MSLEFQIVTPSIAPLPNRPRAIGHGEGVEYNGRSYYYMVGKRIPKDKVVAIRWEGDWCGQVNGEVEYLVVVYSGSGNEFLILEQSSKGYIREVMVKYKGREPFEVISFASREAKKRQEAFDSLPKCRLCGDVMIVFEDHQPKDVCLQCWKP